MKNMGKLLKQAQKMQSSLMKAQEEMAINEFESIVGGGTVKVVLTGDQKLKSIKIDPDAAKDDIEMVQDMIIAAINKTQDDIKAEMDGQVGGLTGEMNIPGLF